MVELIDKNKKRVFYWQDKKISEGNHYACLYLIVACPVLFEIDTGLRWANFFR